MEAFVFGLEPSIAEQLGTDLEDAREFSCVVLYAIECNPKLYEVTRESLAASILTAAKMRLAPGLGLARLSWHRGEDGRPEALFTPSWRGLLQLLRDHGGVVDAWAEVIYANDRFRRGGTDGVEFEAYDRGPRGAIVGVFVQLMIDANDSVGPHVEVLWKNGDIDPVTPDGSDPPDSARGKSAHDYTEFMKTVAFKRAAKWCASTSRKGASLIAAAIELERGSERSRVVPSAERVARMLGIEVPVLEPLKINGVHGPSHVEQLAKEIDEEREAAREIEDPRCCGCGNLASVTGPLKPQLVDPRAMRHGCKGCGEIRAKHDLCASCSSQATDAMQDIQKADAKKSATKRSIDNARVRAIKRAPSRVPAAPAADSPVPQGSGVESHASAPEPPSNAEESSDPIGSDSSASVAAVENTDNEPSAAAASTPPHVSELTPPYGVVAPLDWANK